MEAAKAKLIERRADLDAHAAARAQALGEDHDRVRAAARAAGASEVEAVMPVGCATRSAVHGESRKRCGVGFRRPEAMAQHTR